MRTNRSLKNKKVLVTCGPTWVPIDGIRIISNISTGTLGHLICEEASKQGAKITLLEGPVLERFERPSVRVLNFQYFDELSRLLKTELKKKYDIIIHAAAVSDFKLEKPFHDKISSKQKKLRLDLVPTTKLINLIKKNNPACALVGFKLTSNVTRKTALEKAAGLFKEAGCDLIVANSSTASSYKGFIIDKKRGFLAQQSSRAGMAKALIKILKANS